MFRRPLGACPNSPNSLRDGALRAIHDVENSVDKSLVDRVYKRYWGNWRSLTPTLYARVACALARHAKRREEAVMNVVSRPRSAMMSLAAVTVLGIGWTLFGLGCPGDGGPGNGDGGVGAPIPDETVALP